MADKSNDNYGSHYQLELDYAYEDGQKDGMKNGAKNNQIATAKRMISLGSNDEFISKATGLSINEINALRKKMKL